MPDKKNSRHQFQRPPQARIFVVRNLPPRRVGLLAQLVVADGVGKAQLGMFIGVEDPDYSRSDQHHGAARRFGSLDDSRDADLELPVVDLDGKSVSPVVGLCEADRISVADLSEAYSIAISWDRICLTA